MKLVSTNGTMEGFSCVSCLVLSVLASVLKRGGRFLGVHHTREPLA